MENKNGRFITPVAHIYTDFNDKFGIPRQSGRVEELVGKIVFAPPFNKREALREIEGFSHLWLLFDFSKAHTKEFSPTVRPPRLGGNKRVGVFASRSPFRPNSIGLSSVRLKRVENLNDGTSVLIVSGADLLNGTPIYDIKPYLPFTDCHTDATCGYAQTGVDYTLKVDFNDELLSVLPPEKRTAALNCLAQDPRPSYKEDGDRVYGMSFAGFNIHFKVKDGILTVFKVDKNADS